MNKSMFYVGLAFTIISAIGWIAVGISHIDFSQIDLSLPVPKMSYDDLKFLGWIVYGCFTLAGIGLTIGGALSNRK